MAEMALRGLGLRDVRGGQMSHKEEKKSVRGNVEIEVHKAVNEQARATHEAGQLQRSSEGLAKVAPFAQRLDQQNGQKPERSDSTQNSGLGEGFQIVVVGVIDDSSIVKGFVGRENDLKSAEAGAEDGVIQEDFEGVTAHRSAFSGGGFERLQGGESLEDLANSEPGNHEQSGKQDTESSKQLLSNHATEQD